MVVTTEFCRVVEEILLSLNIGNSMNRWLIFDFYISEMLRHVTFMLFELVNLNNITKFVVGKAYPP